MKKSFASLVWDQWKTVPTVATADLTGQTVIVTGANIGLGFESAKHFAKMNPAKLILACRSEEKGKAAVESTSRSFVKVMSKLILINHRLL